MIIASKAKIKNHPQRLKIGFSRYKLFRAIDLEQQLLNHFIDPSLQVLNFYKYQKKVSVGPQIQVRSHSGKIVQIILF